MVEEVFHLDPDGTLLSMTPAPYATTDLLNSLVQAHPELLAGHQLGSGRRWVLVLPSTGGTVGRQSVSLYLDQDGVPTLVSARLADDEARRRDLVGQVLDLAANGLSRWPIEELRSTYDTTQRRAGRDPDETLALLCPGRTPAEFFDLVEANLADGRLRIVIVAQRIPVELVRIAEFLNEQMSPAEVFAVEVTQFRADAYAGVVIISAPPPLAPSTPTHLALEEPPEEEPAASSRETRELVQLISALASETGLGLVRSATAVGLAATDGEVLASVDLEWGTLSVPLQRLSLDDAEAVSQVLSGLTRVRLDAVVPSLPARRVVTRWSEVRLLLEQLALAREDDSSNGRANGHPNGHRH